MHANSRWSLEMKTESAMCQRDVVKSHNNQKTEIDEFDYVMVKTFVGLKKP